eukprot:NODE_107_length_18988_cov_0.534491.p19 type:complete len:127 gc:universal NODE_107_length_18988_cov_0.534491:5023-5403(+)
MKYNTMFSKLKLKGKECLLPSGKVIAVNNIPTEKYMKSLHKVLNDDSKNCPMLQSELQLSYWAPIRDYRSPYIPNRLPPIEDIFGFCSRDGQVQVNDFHIFYTEKGFPQFSPFLMAKLESEMGKGD